MEDTTARDDACREYESSLEDLTFNSKPHINMLTILAEENISFAKDIVGIIEAQISKAPALEKLPVLYLVDSIVKNVGRDYLTVFAKNLIPSFICVFEKVDENTRKSLFKLRSTWDEVFPAKKLYALDVRVSSVDPAWPIKPLPPAANRIHVNPNFLKQPDEPPAARPAPPSPRLTQEQLIRQQLLAKQKQLLELQQKKIELELEQTKAQLTTLSSLTPKPLVPPATVIRPWIPPQTAPTEAKQPPPVTTTTTTSPAPTMRDPRLNRLTPSKEKKDLSPAVDRKHGEKKPKPQRLEETTKSKSKSPSPLTKRVPNSNDKSVEEKKDPRLKKRPQEKPDGEEIKEKKKREDDAKDGEDPKKKREEVSKKPKLVNGSVTTKEEFKMGGNARTHARKRSRSHSRSPGSLSPKYGGGRGGSKEKERRSPKPCSRGRSSSPSPHKSQHARSRDGRGMVERGGTAGGKKSQSESGRRKGGGADDRDSLRGHDPGSKEAKDGLNRWRSGWDDGKHGKDEPHKPAAPRHKPHPSPRTPKHRLSVDANLQIPEVLNSASKKDLLRRASKRLESGEISEEEFLNLAHQIKHLFQYQEEKQRGESWEQSPKSSSSSGQRPQRGPPDGLDPAQASYYEHKSKLRKSQVSQRPPSDEWPDENEGYRRLDKEVKSGYDRRFPERRPEPPSHAPQEPPRFERERLSPLPAPHLTPRDQPDASPVPRFESPNSEHSEEGPMEPGPPQNLQPKSILKVRHDEGLERSFSEQPPVNRPQQVRPVCPWGPPCLMAPWPPAGLQHGPPTFPRTPDECSLPLQRTHGLPGTQFHPAGAFPPAPGSLLPPGPNPGLGMPQQQQQPVMMGNMNAPFMPQNTVPFPQAPPAPENHFGQVDVNDLLSKLISTGIIKPSQPEAPSTAAPVAVEEEEEEEELSEEDLPDLTSFSLDAMKQRYESAVTRLYTGNQCCLCSMRFTAAQTDLYADHLDWHFRQNHAGKVAAKKITHRRWYYGLTDWIEFEEIADLEERAKSLFFEKENEEEEQKNQAAAKEKEIQIVRATKDQVAELCEICQEPFETYWVEEEEDWFLKNAIRVDDKNFHPACFEDYQKTSYIDATPSPSKHLTEHPLSALNTEEKLSVLIKTEDEDRPSCAEVQIKQEVDEEVKQEVTVKQEPASS
uniref:Pre-mRNA cleavage complex 2 protein Pcf11 n=1 Tax=Neogobius melanostomus TaxID=47308 RepID=A0A8C6WUS9_9GOBI